MSNSEICFKNSFCIVNSYNVVSSLEQAHTLYQDVITTVPSLLDKNM